jgi:hypothetical protein
LGRHVSQRAYARERGVTHRSVRKQLDAGHIHLEADNLIDVDRANAEWAGQASPARRFAAAAVANPAPPPPPTGRNGQARAGTALSLEAFAQARTLNETYKARTTRLKFERLEGGVVPADNVRLAAFKLARAARDLLMALPDRLSAVLAANSDPEDVHRILAAEIRQVCEELGRPLTVKGTDGESLGL